MRKEPFINDYFYHIYNRGVDKRTIFLEERDYVRFVSALYLFNDANQHDYDLTKINLRSLASYPLQQKECLVNILHWCLMPNHFHLLLKQRITNGISIFMQKVGTSYSKYFNHKHDRSGRLFEGTFKSKTIDTDEYFSHLSSYIPLNCVELYCKQWKEKGIQPSTIPSIKKRILKYKWSSIPDYFDKSLVPSLITKGIFFEVFGGSLKDYEKLIDTYLSQGLPLEYKERLLVYEA